MNYHNITKDDMLNGYGLRVVLWVSGCTHHCIDCHNPETWDINSGIAFDDNAKNELFEALGKDYISGITLSGGDPLHPYLVSEMASLVSEIKEKFPNKTIWLYTGFLFEDIKDIPFIKDLDVLVDGKFDIRQYDSQLHWKGSKNQRVINVTKSLENNTIVLYD